MPVKHLLTKYKHKIAILDQKRNLIRKRKMYLISLSIFLFLTVGFLSNGCNSQSNPSPNSIDDLTIKDTNAYILDSSKAYISLWKTDMSIKQIHGQGTPDSGQSDINQIRLPLVNNGTYDFIVRWGDGSKNIITSWNDSAVIHTYEKPGEYQIMINGKISGWSFEKKNDCQKIINISQWGCLSFGYTNSQFNGCRNLDITAEDTPDLTETKSLWGAFDANISLKGTNAFSKWDVSNITNMGSMFSFTDLFNQDIGNWNVSNVTYMVGMFNNAWSFNQDIGRWNVSNVTNMSKMFNNAWSFNQDIGRWDVSKVTNMWRMFYNVQSFNQNIGNWDVSNVTNMSYMFSSATSFNQDIGRWDVSNVNDMSYIFSSATSFNQDVDRWDVSNVTDMVGMFNNATSFNQDIGSWDVSKVTDMKQMFYGAMSLNQDVGSWNVSNVTNMRQMFDESKLSTSNYDAILLGWSGLDVKKNVELGSLGIKYSTNAAEARNKLINEYGWNISDGGIVE